MSSSSCWEPESRARCVALPGPLPFCPESLTNFMLPQSTVLKQMRLHHVGGYSNEERDGYREIVYANLVRARSGPRTLSMCMNLI